MREASYDFGQAVDEDHNRDRPGECGDNRCRLFRLRSRFGTGTRVGISRRGNYLARTLNSVAGNQNNPSVRGPIPQRIVTAFGNRVNSAAFEKRDQYFSFRTRFERRERNEFDAVLCCKRVVPHGAPPPIGHPARVYAGFASALARL